MRTKIAYKGFVFNDNSRPEITLGAGVRLVPRLGKVELKAGNDGFATEDNLYVKTRLTSPGAGRGWLVFMAIVKNKTNSINSIVTSVGFRLSTDGITELYWDGSEWVGASAGQWNTEAEINVGLPEFGSPRAIQVIANLKTTDPAFTPELYEIRLAYRTVIEFQEDYLRSILQLMKAEVRPIAQFKHHGAGVASSTLNPIETPYNIVGIDSVFNLTQDPDNVDDLFSSWVPDTHTINYTTAIPDGEIGLVRFLYAPEIALTTSQDYTEVAKVPGVVIDDVTLGQRHQMSDTCFVINKATGSGYVWRKAYQQDIQLSIKIITDKALDQQRLAGEMKRFFVNNQFLKSIGLDEKFRLWFVEEYDQLTVPAQDELHTGRLRARIVKALFFPQDAEPITGVTSFHITGGNLSLEI